MPSPFPGMDPYIEHPSVWQDFHDRFLPALADAIGVLVLPNFIVKVSERLFVSEIDDDEPRFFGNADVAVKRGPADATVGLDQTAVLEAPVFVTDPDSVEEEAQTYLEIFDRDLKELVTVVELLSPVNKRRGDKREQYLAKRRAVLNSPTHLVEIDLLRAGPRMPLVGLPPCDYCIHINRADQRPHGDAWPFGLRDPLPTIPIPLRSPFPHASIALRSVFDRVYDAAGYSYYIYRQPPEPALRLDDARWASQLMETSLATVDSGSPPVM